MTAHTQKALLVRDISKPLVLVDNWPVPEPRTSQAQIKVTVAGINPHDQAARDRGFFIKDHLPAILANDVVGTVTKLGEGVTSLAVGDRIVSQGAILDFRQAGLQEYAVADLVALAKIPDSITDDEAATLPTNIFAPLTAIFLTLEIPAPWMPAAAEFDYVNTTLLIIGGGTNCGRFGVQLAKLVGIGRIVVLGGNQAELKSFGATHVLDRHADYNTLLSRIRDVVGDDLIYAYDTINPPEKQLLALNALSSRKRGILARLVPHGPPFDESKVLGKKAGFEVRDVFGSSQVHPDLAVPFWQRVPKYLESGELKPLAYAAKKGLSADHVNEVLDSYRDGKHPTKTHIHI